MRQIRTDQGHMPCCELTDVITGHQLAAALADQMNFEFRMMVPARQCVGIVVLVPAKAVVGLREDNLKLGRALLEQGGSAVRHGCPFIVMNALWTLEHTPSRLAKASPRSNRH